MSILQQSQRKIDKTSVSFAKKYIIFWEVYRSDRNIKKNTKWIQNCEQIVRFSNVSCVVKQMIRINHHDHCDCDPSHQQNYWIFRFVSVKFLNDAQEKIKYGILFHHSPWEISPFNLTYSPRCRGYSEINNFMKQSIWILTVKSPRQGNILMRFKASITN